MSNSRGRQRRAARRRIGPVLVVVIVLILVIAIIGVSRIIDKYTPTKETQDLYEYFGIAEGTDRAAIIYNEERLETEQAFSQNGELYLSYSFVHDELNPIFYWDETEQLLLYTTATDVITATVDSPQISVSGETQTEDYAPVTLLDGVPYVAVDFASEYSDFTYEIYEAPERILITNEFGSYTAVTASEATQLRVRGGIKSPILKEVAEGETLKVLDHEENWTKVADASGLIGYVTNKSLNEETTESLVSGYIAPEYSHVFLNERACVLWHQVTGQAGNASVSSVLAQSTAVNVLSPTWFYLDDNEGNIEDFSSAEYVAACHQQGVQVWGLVSNLEDDGVDTSEVLSVTSKRNNLVNQLIAAAILCGMDGINVDFEAISTDAGDGYIQFIRELALKCHNNGLVLSVDDYVPSNYTTIYAWDQQALFGDYVILMAYDEHYAGSEEAGSVASLDFVQQGVQDMIGLGVPAEQLILGMPFYTRIWTENAEYQVSSRAVGMSEAVNEVTAAGATVTWLEQEGQYYAEYQSGESLCQVWLEDQTSLEKKMDVMIEQGLAGGAFWKSGLEDITIWQKISEYMAK